jgi:hypothetical protein
MNWRDKPIAKAIQYLSANTSYRVVHVKNVIGRGKNMTVKSRLPLSLNIQFFSEGGEDTGWVDSNLEGLETPGENQKQPEDNMIPKKRFDDINSRYKALNEDYKNRQTEYDDMVKQLDETKVSTKQLEETIAAGNQRVEALEGVLKTMLDAELEQVDEEYRELVPADKPIEQQLEWLAKAKSKGLFVSKGMEFEIGGMSNPGRQGGTTKGHENMNPLQLLTMGYSN